MINYLIKIITILWFIFFCLQVSVAQEIDVNQTRKHLLQTLQDNSVDKQQRMELYIDLYDLSDDVTSKRTYINESLQLAIQLKNQIYIFETLDILCRSYKDEPDSLRYYQQIGEECLEGAYKDFYMAWLKAFPSVCKMDEAEKPDEANEEISRYKRHKVNLSDKSQEVQWEMILCSAMECISYFSPSVANSEDRIVHLKNIHHLVSGLPFEVSYKFNWYYLTRIEFIYRAEGKAEEAAKAVEALEQTEQLYDNQFELPFYKRRAYIRTRSREALRMGVYSELLYFGDIIGRKRADEIYSRMKEYYQVKTPEENKEWLLPSAFRYYFYTAQYDLAMRTIDELLEQTDSADTNSRTELLAKKINLVTRWKQHYKEGFDAFCFCLCGMCAELFSGGSFSSGFLGGSTLLFGDLLQHDSQTGNGSQHGTQNLSLQDRQSGNRSQRLNGGQIDGLAVHEAALDLELAVQLLGIVGHDAGRSHGIISQSQRSGAIQQIIQIVQASVVESKAQQGVLHNRIIHAALTALLTQSGVFLNGNTLVVDNDACGSLLDLLGQLGNDGLLLGKDLCVRHNLVSPP